MSKRILFSMVLTSLTIHLCGQYKIIGHLGTDWHNPTHWDPAGIPTANDSVLIFGTAIIQPDSTGRALHVTVHENGTLQIDRDIPSNKPGKLIIRNSPGNGIYNEGIINNGGRITIKKSGSVGIENEANMKILDRAKVQVDSTTGDGVRSTTNSIFEIAGELTIHAAGNNALYSYGDTVIVDSTAEVVITNATSRGIFNFGDYFINRGIIDIDSSGDNGFYSSGKLINQDTIIVTRSGDNGFMNYDSLINTATGYINVSNTGSHNDGYYNDVYTENQGMMVISDVEDHGINTYYPFMNEGTILLDDCHFGVINGGPFFNNGHLRIVNGDIGIYIDDDGFIDNADTISIDSTKEYGVMNRDSVYNQNGASISIQGLHENSAVGWENVDNDAKLMNSGKIYIYDTDSSGIVNNGSIFNNEVVELQRTDHTSIQNNNLLFNEQNAQIFISVSNGKDAALTNAQEISSIVNHGILKIENCEGPGISNLLGFIANYDTLSINNIVDIGLNNLANFINNVSGEVIIKSVSKSLESPSFKESEISVKRELVDKGVGILNELAGTFTNSGKTEINDIFFGVINSANFNNTDSLIIGHSKTTGIKTKRGLAMSMNLVKFSNFGYILVQGDIGMEIRSDFINEINGHIDILTDDDSYFESFLNAEFICNGTMEMRAPDPGGGSN